MNPAQLLGWAASRGVSVSLSPAGGLTGLNCLPASFVEFRFSH
jgi:hypothetical protein